MKNRVLTILCVLAAGGQFHSSMAHNNSYALTNVNLFNGIDNEIYESKTVFVKDGKIDRIAGMDVADFIGVHGHRP